MALVYTKHVLQLKALNTNLHVTFSCIHVTFTFSLTPNPFNRIIIHMSNVFQTKLTTLDLAGNRLTRLENVSHLVLLEELWVSSFIVFNLWLNHESLNHNESIFS